MHTTHQVSSGCMSHDVLHSLLSQLLLYFLLIGSLSSLSGYFLTTRICTPVLCMVTDSLYRQSCKLNPVNVHKVTYMRKHGILIDGVHAKSMAVNPSESNAQGYIFTSVMLQCMLPFSISTCYSRAEPDSQPKSRRGSGLFHILFSWCLNFRGR